MDIQYIKEHLNRNHIILAVGIIVLLWMFLSIFTLPPSTDDVVYFDEFSFVLPDFVEYSESRGEVEIVDPYTFVSIKNYSPEEFDQVFSYDYTIDYYDFNSTHYVGYVTSPDNSINTGRDWYFTYVDIIIPKKSFNMDEYRLNESSDIIVLESDNDAFLGYIESTFELGGKNGS